VVLIHYHLFKNAGTSLDHALRQHLGDRFMAYERDRRIEGAELLELLADHPGVVAVSSHNAWLPPPVTEGMWAIPLVFVRHPLDRARSIYEFERTQPTDRPEARMARRLDLRGYLEWRLDRLDGTDRTLRDFQAMRLAPAGSGDTELERALDAIDHLPFVGSVERFRESLRRLEGLVGPHLPGFRLSPIRLNQTAGRSRSLEVRLARLRAGIGPRTYERLEQANGTDLALWARVRATFDDARPRRLGGLLR
jgi:hypothetical protein